MTGRCGVPCAARAPDQARTHHATPPAVREPRRPQEVTRCPPCARGARLIRRARERRGASAASRARVSGSTAMTSLACVDPDLARQCRSTMAGARCLQGGAVNSVGVSVRCALHACSGGALWVLRQGWLRWALHWRGSCRVRLSMAQLGCTYLVLAWVCASCCQVSGRCGEAGHIRQRASAAAAHNECRVSSHAHELMDLRFAPSNLVCCRGCYWQQDRSRMCLLTINWLRVGLLLPAFRYGDLAPEGCGSVLHGPTFCCHVSSC